MKRKPPGFHRKARLPLNELLFAEVVSDLLQSVGLGQIGGRMELIPVPVFRKFPDPVYGFLFHGFLRTFLLGRRFSFDSKKSD